MIKKKLLDFIYYNNIILQNSYCRLNTHPYFVIPPPFPLNTCKISPIDKIQIYPVGIYKRHCRLLQYNLKCFLNDNDSEEVFLYSI